MVDSYNIPIPYPMALPVPSANFNGEYKTPTVTTQFTSGKIRRRRIGGTSIKSATLEWLFSPEEFDIWEVFFRDGLKDGCNKFLIEMCTGGSSQTGSHVVQCVDDYQFSHEECNWRVSVGCIIFPYPKGGDEELLEGFIGGPVSSLVDILNKYYDRNFQL